MLIYDLMHEQRTRIGGQCHCGPIQSFHSWLGAASSGAIDIRFALFCFYSGSMDFFTGMDWSSLVLPERRALEA